MQQRDNISSPQSNYDIDSNPIEDIPLEDFDGVKSRRVMIPIKANNRVKISDINEKQERQQQHPIKLSFEGLEFEITVPLSRKDAQQQGTRSIKQKIVKNASGFALPGQTLYIMGSSGAGKTSFLNMLSDRISAKNGQTVKGNIMINDVIPLNQKTFGDYGAYVMQDDVLFEDFTPYEALKFASKLKLGGSEDEQERRVQDILAELSLTHVQNTRIGSAVKKSLSGGERKRTAIGVELITDPQLILLDEPTSGLDSFKAFQIVKLLDKLAKNGKTIISTIHQPSSESFRLFDRLILMMDGNIVYQGLAKESTKHFAQLNFVCPVHSNPSDYFMKVLTVNYPKQAEDEKHIKLLAEHYNQALMSKIKAESKANVLQMPDSNQGKQNRASWWSQLEILIWRNFLATKRNPELGRMMVFKNVFLGLLSLALFHDQFAYNQAFSLISSLFFVVICQMMLYMMPTLLTFQGERPVFLREQANQMYNVGPYYLAKIIVETPRISLLPIVFTVIIYFKIGLTITASQFFYFYLILMLLAHCCASIGYLVSSIFDKAEVALQLSGVILMPLVLFGGQFANSDTIQDWISWFQYLSPIRYGYEALVINEFDNRHYNSTMILQHMTKNYTVSILNAFANNQTASYNMTEWMVTQTPERNPSGVMGFDWGMWKCLLLLAVLTVVLRALSFIFLKALISKFQ